MNKIGLVIAREYLTRVKKKSFIIMSIVGPILIAGLFVVPILLSIYGGDTKTIVVKDESGLFAQSFDGGDIEIEFSTLPDDSLKNQVLSEKYDGYLRIPEVDVDKPVDIELSSKSNLGIDVSSDLRKAIRNEIEEIKLKRSGIDQATLDNLKADVDVKTFDLSKDGKTEETSAGGASMIGWISAFLIYMFIFIYGAQIMRGVIEEKTSKVVEVVISSVKPFQMMMGKVIGIAGVGLTQLVIWIVLSQLLIAGATVVLGTTMGDPQAVTGSMSQPEVQEAQNQFMSEAMSTLDKMNLPLIVVSFLFFFLGGYLLYGSLFAAVGSAVDSDADSQQFMLPVSIPLILSIVMLGPIINDPNGSLAFWMSIIPFTSPVIMMMRVAFGVPIWQLILSMSLLIGGFIFTIWVAGRIYRVGILMHGTKVNYKILAKWFMTKQ